MFFISQTCTESRVSRNVIEVSVAMLHNKITQVKSTAVVVKNIPKRAFKKKKATQVNVTNYETQKQYSYDLKQQCRFSRCFVSSLFSRTGRFSLIFLIFVF